MIETSEIIAQRRVQVALGYLVQQAALDAGVSALHAARMGTSLVGRLESGAPHLAACQVVEYVLAARRDIHTDHVAAHGPPRS